MTDIVTNKNKIKNKVKNNISFFKKDKPLKINLHYDKSMHNKSMDEAIMSNQVLLWGLNKIDSILLNPYEKNYSRLKIKQNITTNNVKMTDDDITNKYIHKYTHHDLNWLNHEYEIVENKILKLTDLTDEYDDLLNLQDHLSDLINELMDESKNNQTNKNKDFNQNEQNDVLMEIEIKPLKSTKSTKSTKSIKPIKPIKPYYWIGEIPPGYREATQEEAILNKKVSLFGKKKVDRELHSLFEITGTIYINTDELAKLNQHIISLKGKINYYKKDLIHKKILLNSDAINQETETEIKNKILNIKNCYKKTIDMYNLYVKKYIEIKNQTKKITNKSNV